jgi:glycosyltransferase involved in cell wall biosynthesis
MLSCYPPDHYGTVSRLSRWVPHLEARGTKVTVLCPANGEQFRGFPTGDPARDYAYHAASLRNQRVNLRRAAAADVVLLHRGVFPFGPWQRPTFERLLARANPRLIYDFYDSIWVQRHTVHDAAKGRIARWLNPRDLIETIIGCARVVTVSGEFLADFARPLHDDVRIFPMLLEPDEYDVRRHAEADPVVVTWMGNRWNVPRIRSISGALAGAARRSPIRLRLVAPETIEMPGVPTDSLTHPWSPESERDDLLAADIGLLPLFQNTDDRGKFPFKLLQYAAAGLPIVASSIGVAGTDFVPGESVLTADDDEAWTEAVVALATDVRLRARLGAAARRVLEERYAFAAHADRFHAMLEEVADGGAR